jgi:hypothetical protein
MSQNRKGEPPRSRLMSQSAAASLLGCARGTLVARIASGEIEAELVDDTPVPVRASVEAYHARQLRAEPAVTA